MGKCPHCGKTFKINKSLCKHIMICQLHNKDNEITVLPSQKEMWLIVQKLYKDNEILKKKSREIRASRE